jgi:predicted dienelactone hydrolase
MIFLKPNKRQNLSPRRRTLLVCVLAWLSPFSLGQTSNALKSKDESEPLVNTIEGTITHPKTKRELKIRIYVPLVKKKSPLIIYSPGLGSGVNNGRSWCEAWATAGNLVVTISHPVTNDVIWDTKTSTFTQRLQQSLAAPQYDLRVMDCQFVITQCLLGSKSSMIQNNIKLANNDLLEDYIDPDRIGIAGHSYGALTVQSISGQNGGTLLDPRIKAAIAFSPGSMTQVSAKKMESVKIPFFCIMGDHDNQVTFKKGTEKMTLGMPLAKRRWVYENLPRGSRQLWIVSPADHMTFAGEVVDGQSFSRDIQIEPEGELQTWQRINQMTTAFWQQYLSGETNANNTKTALADYEKLIKKNIAANEVFERS